MTDDARRLIRRPSHMRANAGRNRQSAAPWQHLFGNGDLSYQTKSSTRWRKSNARRWYRHVNTAVRRSDRQRARADIQHELDDLLGRDHVPKRGRAAWFSDDLIYDWSPDPYSCEPTAEQLEYCNPDCDDDCECHRCRGCSASNECPYRWDDFDDYDPDDRYLIPETDARWVEHWLAGADAPGFRANEYSDYDMWYDEEDHGPWYVDVCDHGLDRDCCDEPGCGVPDAPWLEQDEQDRRAWYPGNPASDDRDREHSRHGRRRHGSGLRAVAAGSPPRGRVR